MNLRIGTRKSKLALWQAYHVKSLLEAVSSDVTCEIVHFVTEGDKSQASGKPLPQIGGKGLFTLELENALRNGSLDLAVHSLKDLPVEQPEGLTLGAVPRRGMPEDVLVAKHPYRLGTLPFGAIVGTSSLRRQAQLLAARPDLNVQSIRGNVPTRIQKMVDGQYHAIVLARAGVERLEMTDYVRQVLPIAVMLPAPGQGALGIQCRADDETTRNVLQAIDDRETNLCVSAERLFLHKLQGGCSVPVGAYAHVQSYAEDGTPEIHLQTVVASPDGNTILENAGVHRQIGRLATVQANRALAAGAADLLNSA